ncbi:hypothetical protein BDQ17DRAFT_1435412 [Cyathus striatus]|nr:hypothetical protein BDQ17DRAFT_1435412 [Cyathus striatus]
MRASSPFLCYLTSAATPPPPLVSTSLFSSCDTKTATPAGNNGVDARAPSPFLHHLVSMLAICAHSLSSTTTTALPPASCWKSDHFGAASVLLLSSLWSAFSPPIMHLSFAQLLCNPN